MITVCIATYNGARFIEQQIRSILPQLEENDEVILSDDGSTDKTISIVSNIADARIRIIPNNGKKHSPTTNFENALKYAKGDYIFLSDQDDIWMSQKVKKMMGILKQGRYDCVVSDAMVTDAEGNITSHSLFKIMHVRHNRIYNLFVHNGYTGCCMAFNKNVLKKSLPFPDNIPMHDIWIGNVAAFFFNVGFINEPLIKFRRHEDAASYNGMGSKYSICQKIMFRWNTFKNIFKLWKHS